MPQFRATIDCDSPAKTAERLKGAGLTLLGPWAAEPVSAATPLGLIEELEVSALMEAVDSREAEKRLREVLDGQDLIRIVEVQSSGN